MKIDLMPLFKKYEALVSKAESVFEQVKTKYPNEVKCKEGCADCCHALFDLTLIEALYINYRFNEKFSGKEKIDLIEKANKADRQIYKIKKEAYRSTQGGKEEEAVVEEIGQKRIRCPLLGEENLCETYAFRPIACRVYGIPQAIGGKGRTCGLSGFKAGENYPTLNHDIIHDQLMTISSDLVQAIRSKHIQMAEVLVPLSMALITDYNEEYLGIRTENEPEGNKENGGNND
ncbi:MAG: YkgJ family cysteine cluster protein [Desulfobacteraceae bacterium]|nr:YkgJ family cysteine cluster protein [Desulfobacteraceae bacterium]MBC2757037.1 YkgJ family cysteine cluster protein [Desulfobacteraceae bacterium]